MSMERRLGFADVFSIATGGMISSGIFVLPALAYQQAGSGVFLAYLLAGAIAAMGSLSTIELATAMPRAGGDYFYVTRTLGPLAGVVSGTLSWFSLSLKAAFAVYGLSALIAPLTGLPLPLVGLGLTTVFLLLNFLGVEAAGRIEVVLVVGLLAIMVGFVVLGLPEVDPARFSGQLLRNLDNPELGPGLVLIGTAGFVFVSYGGLVKAATVAEEVRNPQRNIPAGILSSVIVVTILYGLMLYVSVGVKAPGVLSESVSPMADAAEVFAGTAGYIALSVAAILAFVTTANAGLIAASRYPLAMARDRLVPAFFGNLTPRKGTPVWSLVLTAVLVSGSLFTDLELLVKAASAVIIGTNLLTNLSVLIIRRSRLQNYRPTFRAPFFPVPQLLSIVVFTILVVDMGAEALLVVGALIVLAVLIYLLRRGAAAGRDYALLHLVERITNRSVAGNNLEGELRDILHDVNDIQLDSFDVVVQEAEIIDERGPMDRAQAFRRIAGPLAERSGLPEDECYRLLQEREALSSTAISPFIAVPHIVVDGESFGLVVLRCREGVAFAPGAEAVHAVFVLYGATSERTRHLQALAAIAQVANEAGFEEAWLHARSPENLRDLVLLSNRRRLSPGRNPER